MIDNQLPTFTRGQRTLSAAQMNRLRDKAQQAGVIGGAGTTSRQTRGGTVVEQPQRNRVDTQPTVEPVSLVPSEADPTKYWLYQFGYSSGDPEDQVTLPTRNREPATPIMGPGVQVPAHSPGLAAPTYDAAGEFYYMLLLAGGGGGSPIRQAEVVSVEQVTLTVRLIGANNLPEGDPIPGVVVFTEHVSDLVEDGIVDPDQDRRIAVTFEPVTQKWLALFRAHGTCPEGG